MLHTILGPPLARALLQTVPLFRHVTTDGIKALQFITAELSTDATLVQMLRDGSMSVEMYLSKPRRAIDVQDDSFGGSGADTLLEPVDEFGGQLQALQSGNGELSGSLSGAAGSSSNMAAK